MSEIREINLAWPGLLVIEPNELAKSMFSGYPWQRRRKWKLNRSLSSALHHHLSNH
jgi:hypothetical protein